MTASHRWVEEDPDGQQCCLCGDQIFLFPPKRMEVTVQPQDVVFIMDYVICASCFDMSNDED